MLLLLQFYQSLPTNVCSQIELSQIRCDGQWKAKAEKWGQNKTSGHLGFPIVLTVHLIYNHCSPILISLIQEQTVATLPGLPEGKSLATRGHSAEVRWTSSTRAIIFIDFVAAALT